MKLSNIFHPSRSIAGRLTLRVTLAILIIFTIMSAIVFTLIWVIGFAAEAVFYEQELENSNEKAKSVLAAVEACVANNAPEVEEFIGEPDKMYDVIERILTYNPNIMGTAVAFVPGFYLQKGSLYCPYAYRSDSVIKTKQLGTVAYDYPHKDWYAIPMKEGRGYWSDPYVDEGGGEVPMITYSLPLINSKGEPYAVLTADITVDWVKELLKTSHRDEDSYRFIVDRKGTFIAYPDEELVMTQNIQQYLGNAAGKNGEKIADDIMDDRQNSQIYFQGNSGRYIYYAPIERTGWKMGIIITLSELLEIGNLLGGVVLLQLFLGMILISFLCYRNIRKITHPISSFAQSANEIAQGNLEAALPEVTSKDEMMMLRNSFDTMQQSLIRQIEDTKAANEQKGRIEGELTTAHNIQMSMLPKTFPPFPTRDDVDVYAHLTPAKEVGGDLYDFFIRDEKLYFCVGDVSGKGVPASLLMAVTRSLFRSMSAHNSSPWYIVSQINGAIAETNDSLMFVTLFVGVLDLPTGRMRYCNAGHCAPVIMSADKAYMLPVDPNVPVGIERIFKFTTQEIVMPPQASIFLYTDGLTEAENVKKELFGEENMMAVCRTMSTLGIKPKTIIDHMTEKVHQFVGDAEQSDDLTMLAVNYSHQQEEDTLKRTLTLPNDINTIPRLSEFIDGICEQLGIDMSVAMSLNLAIEEAVVNVMNYAYPVGTPGEVCITAVANERRVQFVITDTGKPFDPTARGEVDTTLSAEDRPIGGLGIHLVRQIMDSVNYEYAHDMNILTLCKLLTPHKEQTS